MDFHLEQLIPTVKVNDLQESIDFYTGMLGFSLDWRTPGICSVSRGGKYLMLSTLEEIGPSVLWIGVDDITPIYEHLSASGVQCLHPPRNMSYAYETRFADPSGNILWFGSEPLPEPEEVPS